MDADRERPRCPRVMSEGLTFETILRHGNPVISRLKVPTVLLGIRRATRPVTMRTGQLSNCPSDRRPAWTPTILEPARRIAPGPNRLLVQLGQDFANDLRHLVSREWLPPFGFRHFFGEGLDRMGAPDQHVSQRLAARFGVIHAAQRAGNVMVWRRVTRVDHAEHPVVGSRHHHPLPLDRDDTRDPTSERFTNLSRWPTGSTS